MYLERMEEHLSHEEKREDGEHGDAEDGSGREEAPAILAPHRVEEHENELLDKERDTDAVDSAAVDVLVDLGPLVGEVDVVPVHSVLHDKVEQAEGSDEGTDDGVGDGESEDQQHPGVVDPEGELVEDCSSDGGDLRNRFGTAQPEGVHEELGEPHDLQAGPDEGAGGDVVDEECSIVREEDALPVDGVLVPVVVLVLLDHLLEKCSERCLSDGGQDEYHEEKVTEHLPHDPEILHRASPVTQPPVRVGHHDREEGREGPQQECGQEVRDVHRQVVLQIFLQVLGEEGEGLEDRHDVGGGREEEEYKKENDVDQPDFQGPDKTVYCYIGKYLLSADLKFFLVLRCSQ